MIHYHGGPITPETCARRVWSGRHAFISWAEPRQLDLAAAICQSFALDNGAFSAWRSGREVDWDDYYRWCAEWLSHPACDWAVIPDVIGGTEAENDVLLDEWPHGDRGVPVWHMNETTDRLVSLAQRWPRVAIGSAAEYDVARPSAGLGRLADVLPAISGSGGRPLVKLHGLRMLRPEIVQNVPLASGDSTSVARNIGLDVKWTGSYPPATKETRAEVLVERLEASLTPDRMSAWIQPTPSTLFEATA